jgi:hypothetical protein
MYEVYGHLEAKSKREKYFPLSMQGRSVVLDPESGCRWKGKEVVQE